MRAFHCQGVSLSFIAVVLSRNSLALEGPVAMSGDFLKKIVTLFFRAVLDL